MPTGSRLLKFRENHTYLGAQAYLQGFYESQGFVVSGAGYMEDGIAHLPMVRDANLPLPA